MKLGKLCKTQYGTSAATTSDGEQHVLGMSNIGDGRVGLSGLSRVSLSEREASTLRLHKYDVLFNRTNSRALVGKVGILMEEPETPTVFASYLVRLIPNERVRPQWLAYAMSSGITGRSIVRLITLGVSQANINPSELLKWVAIPVPPIEIQDHLLRRFSDFDNAADKLRDQIAVAKNRLRGLMQQLLAGRRRLPAFAGEAWESTPLSCFLEPTSEANSSMVTDRVLSCTKLYGIIAQEERFKQRIASADVSHYKVVRHTDLVFDPMLLWDASIGFVEKYDLGVVSPAYTTFRFTKAENDRRYIRWMLRSHRARHMYKVISQGTNQRRRKAPTQAFLKSEFEMPTSTDERAAIADILDTAQREIELLEQLREQIQLQKRGLMQKLLTGEIRVKGDSVAV